MTEGPTKPPSVADDLGVGKADIAVAGDPTELPRIQVVFRLWQCDKQNHGWPGGTATDRLLPKLRSGGPAFTLRQSQLRTKEEYCFALVAASSSITTLAGIKGLHGQYRSLMEEHWGVLRCCEPVRTRAAKLGKPTQLV
jgi:hypothetical protein